VPRRCRGGAEVVPRLCRGSDIKIREPGARGRKFLLSG
jgi:hypothetical protein